MILSKLGLDIFEESSAEITLSQQDMSDILGSVITESLTDEELEEFLEDNEDVAEAEDDGVLTEATIVKLDKKAKFKRAQYAAMFRIARAKKDKKMKLLEIFWRKERPLLKYLEKKYWNMAGKEVKKAMSNASKSNSKMVKTAVTRVKKSLNMK